jgi:hypothetical protein
LFPTPLFGGLHVVSFFSSRSYCCSFYSLIVSSMPLLASPHFSPSSVAAAVRHCTHWFTVGGGSGVGSGAVLLFCCISHSAWFASRSFSLSPAGSSSAGFISWFIDFIS